MKKFKKIIIILLLAGVIFTLILQVLLSVSGLGLSVFDIYSQKIPKVDKIPIHYEETYFVNKKSFFEKQGKSQCGGFSSAYILRTKGDKITGEECYDQLNHKFANGYVLPQAITDIFKKRDVRSKLYKGNLNTLKTRLNADNPIIILIGDGVKWQHYVTVVGYDTEQIYLYDSNKNVDNSKGYNYVMKNDEFLDQWNNEIPLFERIYFVVE